MPSAGRSNFVRVLPWVLCLALGAAAHLLWALHAWWTPPPVVVQLRVMPASEHVALTVAELSPVARRTEIAEASDPELLAMLVDAYVRCDDDHACVVDPRLLDFLIGSPPRLDRQVRLRLQRRAGEPIGVKLLGIRPGSVPHALGLRAGDTLLGIGELDLVHANGLVDLALLRAGDQGIALRYERDGEPRTLEIELRRLPSPG